MPKYCDPGLVWELESERLAEQDEWYDDEDVFDYLDDLRKSGATNMFGARPYIVDEFGCSEKEAGTLLSKWMTTFSDRHPEE